MSGFPALNAVCAPENWIIFLVKLDKKKSNETCTGKFEVSSTRCGSGQKWQREHK
jgi:hypothetical protein